MESIQLAQMLADISDLSAADSKSANALLSANKTLPTNPSQPSDHLKAPASAPAGASRSAPNRFDKFGRKILTPPTMSRTNSSTGPTSQNPSMPGTPRISELDDEVQQANHLMRLYEIRNQLKQQDSTGLKKAREQIDALIAKNKQQTPQQGDARKPERPGQISRTYTYPRPTFGSTTTNTSGTK